MTAFDAQLVEAVARRTAQLVLEQLDARVDIGPRRLVEAAELARLLNVSRDAVYANADRFGAVRIGDGPRARLRFDVERAFAAQQQVHAKARTPQPTRRRDQRADSSVELLPFKTRGRDRRAA